MRRAAVLLVLLVLAVVSCAGEQLPPLEAPPSPPPALPVVPIKWASVLQVAEDPVAPRSGAPMSLTSAEGVGLHIVALEASAVIEEPLAFTELHFTFQNPEPRAIEGRFEMTLPPGATISRFSMKQENGWQEGEVVEREAARVAYEDFLHRRSDPALLEKQAGNRFQARVFPIAASGRKEIIVSYSEELPSTRAPYRLYLRGLPRLGRMDLRVLFDDHGTGSSGRRSFELHEADFLPDRDFALALAGAGVDRGLRAGELAVARVRPVAEPRPDPIRDLLVLVDTSASRALDLKAQANHLAALLAHVAKHAGADAPVAVACFDQELAPIYTGPAGGFGKREIDAILDRKALGATDLAFALSAAASFASKKGKTFKRVLILTDGVATSGPTDGSDFKAEIRGLRDAGIERLDVMVAGGLRDESLLRALAVGGLARDGLVLDGDLAPPALAEKLGQATTSNIKVRVADARWVWPTTISGVVPGDDVLVYASLPPDRPFAVELATGAGASKRAIETRGVELPLIERAAVQAQIARLSRERDDTTDEKAKAQLATEIVSLSVKHRVLSDLTALLVLETDEDYARFRIDRTALSDVLVVGPAGVDLLRRKAPALQVAAEPTPVEGPDDGDRDGAHDKKVEKKREAHEEGKGGRKQSVSRPAAPGGAPLASAAPAAPPPPAAGPPAQAAVPAAAPEPPPPPPPPPSPSPRPQVRDMEEQRPAAREAPARPAPARAPRPSAGRPAESHFNGGGAAAAPRADGYRSSRSPPFRAPARNAPDPEETGAPPYEGRFAEVMAKLAAKQPKDALNLAWRWRDEDAGDVLALVALGESYEALGQKETAARAYGSIIDLFPSRADLRRFAGGRLERLGGDGSGGLELAIDTYKKAVAQRADHPSSHRSLAYALARAGQFEKAFEAILAGVARGYPSGRFAGAHRVLYEDVGILAAALIKADPKKRAAVVKRLGELGVPLATAPSLRFVLTWETDGNDVDFHIRDGRGGHAYYQHKSLPSGGELFADVTTGYGPECFAIPGAQRAFPYRLKAHYYSKGPMGYGMGKLQIVQHDGRGGLKLDERPYVVMTNRAYVDLGVVKGAL